MTYYMLNVNLQAMYDDETFTSAENLEEMAEIKRMSPTLEIQCPEDEQVHAEADGTIQDGWFIHNLEADNPMDIVRFLIHTKDLDDSSLWEAISSIEPSY